MTELGALTGSAAICTPCGRALSLQAADLDRRRIYEIPYPQPNRVLLNGVSFPSWGLGRELSSHERGRLAPAGCRRRAFAICRTPRPERPDLGWPARAPLPGRAQPGGAAAGQVPVLSRAGHHVPARFCAL